MTGLVKGLTYGAFTFLVLFGVLGGLFVAGETFADPGGWAAVGLTALWLVPLAAMATLARRRPAAAGPVFVAATVVVGSFTLLDAALEVVPRDRWGPVAAIAVFALGVSLAFLGLPRPFLAGLLLTLLALTQLTATLVGFAVHEGTGEGPGAGAALGGSSGVVVVPLLVAGVVFLLAAAFDHESARHGRTPRPRAAH